MRGRLWTPSRPLSLDLRKCWGTDDVAVACLYLALRKRGKKEKKAGRLEVVFEEVFFFFFFYAIHYSTQTRHPTWESCCDLSYPTACLIFLTLLKERVQVRINKWIESPFLSSCLEMVQQQSSWNRSLFVCRRCYHFLETLPGLTMKGVGGGGGGGLPWPEALRQPESLLPFPST